MLPDTQHLSYLSWWLSFYPEMIWQWLYDFLYKLPFESGSGAWQRSSLNYWVDYYHTAFFHPFISLYLLDCTDSSLSLRALTHWILNIMQIAAEKYPVYSSSLPPLSVLHINPPWSRVICRSEINSVSGKRICGFSASDWAEIDVLKKCSS